MFIVKHKGFILFLTSLGVVDFFLIANIILHQDNVIISLLYLSIRSIMSVFLYIVMRYKIGLVDEKFLPFYSAILFHLFSVIGLLSIYLIHNKLSQPSSKKEVLYHIDKEEGEQLEHSTTIGKPISIKFNEIREVAPLADGMTDDNTKTRIAAISAIEETTYTNLFDVLLESKKDASKEVQYYAHEALKKISDKYMKRINELMLIINKSGQDYKTFKEVADLYAVMAHKNIEHPILVRYYRQEAIRYYSDLLKKYQGHRKEILEGLLPILYENGDYKLCINYCEELYKDTRLSKKSAEYKARSLFKLRDIKSLDMYVREQRNIHPEFMEEYIEVAAVGPRNG